MTDYYCDLEKAFADATGADHAGNELTGPAGLQAAIRGTANATALAAGDTLYIKGTGDQSRLVLIDCNGADVTGWGVGDVVHNKDAGSAWQGVVVETNAGAFLGADDIALIWLAVGYDEDDILIAEGVTNDDASGAAGDPTDAWPLAARSTPGSTMDGASGSGASHITLVGVNAAWTEDGTRAILDAKDKATNNIRSTGPNYIHFRNVHGKDALGTGWLAESASKYWSWRNCVASGSGGMGWGDGTAWQYSTAFRCQAYDIAGSHGMFLYLSNMLHCTAYNVAGYGFKAYFSSMMGCVAFQCDTGVYLASQGVLLNCVIDDNRVDGVLINAGASQIIGCRITNNVGYGVKEFATFCDPFTFYCGNGSTSKDGRGVDLVDGVSTRILGTADGYIDGDNADLSLRNYGLTNQAQGRRMEVAL